MYSKFQNSLLDVTDQSKISYNTKFLLIIAISLQKTEKHHIRVEK